LRSCVDNPDDYVSACFNGISLGVADAKMLIFLGFAPDSKSERGGTGDIVWIAING
jgi:hypothetical protein